MGFNLKSKRCRVNGSSPIINLIIFYTVICSLIQMCDCFGDPSNPPFSVSGAFVQNDLGAREVAGMESRLVLDISLYPPSGYYSTGEVVSGQCLLNMDNLFQSLVDVSNHVECFTTTNDISVVCSTTSVIRELNIEISTKLINGDASVPTVVRVYTRDKIMLTPQYVSIIPYSWYMNCDGATTEFGYTVVPLPIKWWTLKGSYTTTPTNLILRFYPAADISFSGEKRATIVISHTEPNSVLFTVDSTCNFITTSEDDGPWTNIPFISGEVNCEIQNDEKDIVIKTNYSWTSKTKINVNMDNLPKANRDVSVKLVDRNYLTNIFQKFDLVFNDQINPMNLLIPSWEIQTGLNTYTGMISFKPIIPVSSADVEYKVHCPNDPEFKIGQMLTGELNLVSNWEYPIASVPTITGDEYSDILKVEYTGQDLDSIVYRILFYDWPTLLIEDDCILTVEIYENELLTQKGSRIMHFQSAKVPDPIWDWSLKAVYAAYNSENKGYLEFSPTKDISEYKKVDIRLSYDKERLFEYDDSLCNLLQTQDNTIDTNFDPTVTCQYNEYSNGTGDILIKTPLIFTTDLVLSINMNPFLYVNDPAKVHVQLSDNSNPSLVFQSFEFTLAQDDPKMKVMLTPKEVTAGDTIDLEIVFRSSINMTNGACVKYQMECDFDILLDFTELPTMAMPQSYYNNDSTLPHYWAVTRSNEVIFENTHTGVQIINEDDEYFISFNSWTTPSTPGTCTFTINIYENCMLGQTSQGGSKIFLLNSQINTPEPTFMEIKGLTPEHRVGALGSFEVKISRNQVGTFENSLLLKLPEELSTSTESDCAPEAAPPSSPAIKCFISPKTIFLSPIPSANPYIILNIGGIVLEYYRENKFPGPIHVEWYKGPEGEHLMRDESVDISRSTLFAPNELTLRSVLPLSPSLVAVPFPTFSFQTPFAIAQDYKTTVLQTINSGTPMEYNVSYPIISSDGNLISFDNSDYLNIPSTPCTLTLLFIVYYDPDKIITKNEYTWEIQEIGRIQNSSDVVQSIVNRPGLVLQHKTLFTFQGSLWTIKKWYEIYFRFIAAPTGSTPIYSDCSLVDVSANLNTPSSTPAFSLTTAANQIEINKTDELDSNIPVNIPFSFGVQCNVPDVSEVIYTFEEGWVENANLNQLRLDHSGITYTFKQNNNLLDSLIISEEKLAASSRITFTATPSNASNIQGVIILKVPIPTINNFTVCNETTGGSNIPLSLPSSGDNTFILEGRTLSGEFIIECLRTPQPSGVIEVYIVETQCTTIISSSETQFTFESGELTKVFCNSACSECSPTDANKCFGCLSPFYFQAETQTCVVNCDDGYREDPSGARICQKCAVENCVGCLTDINTCDLCVSNLEYVSTLNVCDCPSATYLGDNPIYCNTCDIYGPCMSCNSSQCLQCDPGHLLLDDGRTCNSAICNTSPETCAQYEINTCNCTSCSPQHLFQDNLCKSQCSERTYPGGTDQGCIFCAQFPGKVEHEVSSGVFECLYNCPQGFYAPSTLCEPLPLVPSCGNGIVETEAEEECDYIVPGPGCTSSCKIEAGFSCQIHPNTLISTCSCTPTILQDDKLMNEIAFVVSYTKLIIIFSVEVSYHSRFSSLTNKTDYCKEIFMTETASALGVEPKCYINSRKILVILGVNATLIQGSYIRFKGDAIKSLVSSCTDYLTGSFLINKPSLLPIMGFRVDVPSVVPLCADTNIIIRITDISGLARRAPKAMLLQCTSATRVTRPGKPPSSLNIDDLNTSIKSQNPIIVDGSIEYSLPYSVLLTRSTYNMNFKLFNFNNEKAEQDFTFITSSSAQPNTVQIVGLILSAGFGEIYSWQQLNLLGKAWPTECGVDTSQPYTDKIATFTWSMKNSGTNAAVPGIISIGNKLTVNSGTLKAGSVYGINLKAIFPSQASTLVGECTINIRMKESKLQAHIKGSSQNIPTNFGFSLDGRRSFDPDNPNSTSLRYTWRCKEMTQSGTGCVDREGNSIDSLLKAESRVWIPGEVFGEGNRMQFTLTLGDAAAPTRPVVSVSIYIVTVGKVSRSVRIQERGGLGSKRKLNEDINLVAITRVLGTGTGTTTQSESLPKYKWTCNLLNLTTEYIEGALGKYMKIPGHLLASSDSLLLEESIEVRVEVTMNGLTSTASKQLEINKPPLPGDLVLTPNTGTALITPFSFMAVDWQDDDSPLSYTIYYAIHPPNITTINYTGSITTTSNIWKVLVLKSGGLSKGGLLLPHGLGGNRFVIYVKLRVADIFGAYSELIKEVVVYTFPKGGVDGKSFFIVAKGLVDDNSDVDTALQQMTTVGSLLNEEDVDLNATERTNLTDSLFTKMKTSFNTEGCEQDSNMQYLNILKVTSVHNKKQSFTQNTMESTTLEILNAVINSTKSRLSNKDRKLSSSDMLEDEESFVIGSILDNLLSGKEASESEGEDSNSNSKSKSERYKMIKDTGEEMGQMLTKCMSPNEAPRIFIGEKMKVQAVKGSREVVNRVRGVDNDNNNTNIQFNDTLVDTTTTITSTAENTQGEEEEEESKLLDINLLQWDSSIYKFNSHEQAKLLSGVATYNVYNEDDQHKLVNKTIHFRLPLNFTGINANETQCAYYDQINLNFSVQGIQIVERNIEEGYLLCNSTHMSDFGVANIHNETSTILTNANFEESTNISQLENYKFYKSGVFWFGISLTIVIILILLKAYSKDNTDATIQQCLNRRVGYMPSNTRPLPNGKKVIKWSKNGTALGTVNCENNLTNTNLEDIEDPTNGNTQHQNFIENKENKDKTKCQIFCTTMKYTHKFFSALGYYDPKLLRTSRVLIVWTQIMLILLISGLFYNFESGESLSKSMSFTGRIIIAILSVILTLPFAIIMKCLYTKKAEPDHTNAHKVMEELEMSIADYMKLQIRFKRSDKIKWIISTILGVVLGIGACVMANTIAASFGTEKTNDWLLTFSFSMIYDIFIHQTLKAIMVCLIVIMLGSNKAACPGCRNGCLKLISKSLLEAFLR